MNWSGFRKWPEKIRAGRLPSTWRSFLVYPEIGLLLVAVLLLWPLRDELVARWPLAAAIGGLAFFLVPGSALVAVLQIEGPWWERLALALVASLGVPGLLSQAAIFLHTDIRFILWGFGALSFGLLLAALARFWLWPSSTGLVAAQDRPPQWLRIITATMFVGLVVFALNSPLDGDHWDATAYIQNLRHDSHIMTEEPKFLAGLPVSPRFDFGAWLVDQALISAVTGLDPVDQLQAMRLPLMLLSLAAFYRLARRVTGRNDVATLVLAFWLLYLLTSNRGTVAGYEVVVRPDLDKVVAGYIVIPVGLTAVMDFLNHRRRRDVAWLVVASLAAGLTHPIAGVLIGLPLIWMGVAELVVHSDWHTFRGLAVAAAILLIAVVPSVYSLSQGSLDPEATISATSLTDTRDPSMSRRLRGTLDQERIWILDSGDYVMHPRLVFQLIHIPAFLSLPLLFRRQRESRSARLLCGMLILVPAVVLFPPTAQFLGQFTTPWLFYRLHWPISMAAVIVLGWGSWSLWERFAPPTRRNATAVVGWLLVLVVSSPQIRSSFVFLSERRQDPLDNFCVWADPLLRSLQPLTAGRSMVLADQDVNICLPGYAPDAGVMEWRTVNVVRNYIGVHREAEGWERLFDAQYFANSEFLDERLLKILRRWDIQYVVVRLDSPLEPQLRHLPELFHPLTSAAKQRVYRVAWPDKGGGAFSPALAQLVKANSYLTAHEWDQAIATYQKLRGAGTGTTPGVRYLTAVGLGRAYFQTARLDEALLAWEQADQISGEGQTLALRGEVYAIRGDIGPAAQAYREAAALLPESDRIQQRLGDLLAMLGQIDQADEAYQAAAGLLSRPGSSKYYARLGQDWSNIGQVDRAVDALQTSLGIYASKETYRLLGQTYQQARRWPEAEVTYRKMIAADPWDESGHLGLGQIAQAQGDVPRATREFLLALRLHGLAQGVYAALSDLWKGSRGTPAAVGQLQELVGYRLGFGDALLAMADLQAGLGQFEEAQRSLRQATVWDRLGTPYYQAAANYQQGLGYLNEADSGYRMVLELNLDDMAAYLGLARVSLARGEATAAEGFDFRAVLAAPNSAQPYLALGAFEEGRARPDQASDFYRRALTKPNAAAVAWRAWGDFRLRQGELNVAAKSYENALSFQPGFAGAYQGLASVGLAQGRLDEAIQALRRAVELRPGDGATRSSLAAALQQIGEGDAAIDTLSRSLDLDPGYIPAYPQLADAYSAFGREADTEAVYRRLLTVAPFAPDGYLGLGQLSQRRADREGAADWYEQGRTHVAPSGRASILVALANLERRAGDLERASATLAEAVRQQPSLPSAYMSLAQLHALRGDWTSARAVLEEGLARLPASEILIRELADVLIRSGNVSEGLRTYQQGIDLSPSSLELSTALVRLQASLGRPEEAASRIEELGRRWPGNPQVRGEEVSIWIALGEPRMALGAAHELVSVAPGSAASWMSLGLAQAASAQFEEAEHAYRRAVEVESGSPLAWAGLGQFLAGRGETEEAIQALTRAVQLDQSQIASRLFLAGLYDRGGKRVEAISEYEAAREVDATESGPLLALGRMARAEGNPAGAQQYFEQAAAATPAEPPVYEEQASLFSRLGRFDLARLELLKATRLAPGSCEAHLGLADFLASRVEWSLAEAEYTRALSLPGCMADALIALGGHHLASAEPGAAIDEYLRAVTQSPGEAKGYVVLAEVYSGRGLLEKAREMYLQASIRVPSSALTQMARSRLLRAQGDVQAAQAAAAEAVRLAPASPATWITLGDAYQALGMFDQSEANYQRGADADKTNPLPLVSLGVLYAGLARFDEAEVKFHEAVRVAPGEYEGYLGLSGFLRERGRFEEAIEAYEQAANADRTQVSPPIGLARVLALLGRFDDARQTLEQALGMTAQETLPFLEAEIYASTGSAPSWTSEVYTALGDLDRNQTEWEDAEQMYRKAFEVAPGDVMAHLQLAALFSALGRQDEALAQLQTAAELAPGSVSTHVALGDWDRSRGDWAAAEASYQRAIEVSAGDVRGYFGLASVFQSLGRAPDALRSLQQAIAAAPGSAAARAALANWHRSQVHLEEARQGYQEAIRLEPANPVGRVQFAELLQSTGQRGEALALIQESVELSPASAASYLALGDWYRGEANWSYAETAYLEAIRVSPGQIDGYLRLGEIYQAQGRSGDALLQFQTALADSPGDGRSHIALGDWRRSNPNIQASELARQSALDEAIADAREADPTEFPDQFIEHIQSGIEELSLGHVEEAFEQFELAIQMEPDSVLPYLAMGQTYRLVSGPASAEQAYLLAISRAPGDVDGYIHFGQLYQTEGRRPEAQAQFEAATHAAPGSAEAFIALGDWYRSQGEWDAAEAAYTTAVGLTPGDVTAYVRLGELYEAQGRPQDAIAQFELGAKVGLAPQVGVCGLGRLPDFAGALQQGDAKEALRIGSWRCRWAYRPWYSW